MPEEAGPDDIEEALPANASAEGQDVRAEAPARGARRGAIAFKDFVPRQEGTKPALLGLVQAAVYADLEEALSRANAWVARTGVDVINVETVILPNVRETDASALTTNRHDFADCWRQFLRVWYRDPS
jgi:hypothetical protein